MPLIQSRHDGQARLQIVGSFTIFQATDFKAQLLELITDFGESLEIDLSAVEEMDTAGLQLLLLLRRELRAQHKNMVCVGMSPVVENMMEMLQLQHVFYVAPVAGRVQA